jgi:glycosyltransferase involved in cell wall biosynthesis
LPLAAPEPALGPRSLRVVQVIDSLAPGGAEHSTVAILPYLLARGIEPELVLLHYRPGLADQVRAAGVPIHQLSAGQGRVGWIRQLRATLGELRPELVHTCLFESDVSGRVAAASLRIPVVSSLPSELYGDGHLDDPGLSRIRIRAAQVVDGATARLARRLHAVSGQVADTMAVRLRYPRGRIDVVYRGRPADLAGVDAGFDGAALRRSVGVDHGWPVLLVVARHERPKGIDRAIEVLPGLLALHPNLVLLVAGGDGEHSGELHALVDRLGLQRAVRFLGYRHDVAALLRISDVFVLLSRREGLPGALLEAMAAGTPAVVNDLPQIREVVGEGEAVIVAAGRADSVLQGISCALGDAEAGHLRAERARDRFLREFTLDGVADRMAAFYRRSLLG